MRPQARLLVSLKHASTLLRRTNRVLNEIPIVLFSGSMELETTRQHYVSTSQYRDHENQTQGLFPFEERMLDEYFPRPPAHLLVHGAGGGREVLALRKRGYSIDAFEPVPEMVEAANQLVEPVGVEVQQASLQDWAPQGTDRYDGVVTGWGMWTHIVRHADRVAALKAFRQCAPNGPVLLSFWRREPVFSQKEKPLEPAPVCPVHTDRLRRLSRNLLRQRILGLPPIERGLGFSNGFYFHLVDEAELREEAGLAGYSVAYYEHDGSRYPHAVLLPR